MDKFKAGDLVTCSESHEIEQPMRIIGKNPWCIEGGVYHVVGKHKRNGNEVVITLTEGILKKFEE